eukprot:scaffold733_cov267-Pinguiococcus_pyrenoidosus.AAC.63
MTWASIVGLELIRGRPRISTGTVTMSMSESMQQMKKEAEIVGREKRLSRAKAAISTTASNASRRPSRGKSHKDQVCPDILENLRGVLVAVPK